MSDDTNEPCQYEKMDQEVPEEVTVADVAHRLFSESSPIDHPSMLVLGARRTGKSFFIQHLLWWMDEHQKGQYEAAFLISGSAFNGDYTTRFPKRYTWLEFNESTAAHITRILDNQKRLIEEDEARDVPTGKIPRVLFLLDDIMGTDSNALWQGAKGLALTRLWTRGRHLHCTCILAIQRFTAGLSNLRPNSDMLVLFKEPSRLTRKTIIENHLCCYESTDAACFRAAERFYEAAYKSQYHALIVDLVASRGAKRLNDFCFSCKAPDEKAPPSFHGPPHHYRQTPS